MNSLFLLADIAGQRVALPAEIVVSVVEIDAITPVPLAPRHILGLAALRSRTITIIDTRFALGVADVGAAPSEIEAVVVKIDEHLYGLAVERVEDIVTIEDPPRPIRARLDAGWARAARGMIDHEGKAIVLLDPAAIVAGPAALAA